ncbi:MAG TPA: ABC transporter substrate-binding protein, partial [Candidatus Eremiobacteraceae bacterium]|nr:ABC transporter substrate-binding protein [Candidatus Eremiobacteraceae bacterium]
PPFDDVRVRQAFAYAIDWKEINDKAYLGLDVPGITDTPPLSWAFDPSVRPYPYEPAMAKQLLEAAGWRPGPDGSLMKDGKPFAVDITTVIGNTTRLEAEELIQAQLRQIGVDVEVHNYPANLLFATGSQGVLFSGRFDLALYGWSEDPDPDDIATLSPASIPPGGVNYTFYADPDIARWQLLGESRYERSERLPYYWDIQERIHAAVPFHTINWQSHIDAVNTDLENFRPAPAIADFWNAYQWKI